MPLFLGAFECELRVIALPIQSTTAAEKRSPWRVDFFSVWILALSTRLDGWTTHTESEHLGLKTNVEFGGRFRDEAKLG